MSRLPILLLCAASVAGCSSDDAGAGDRPEPAAVPTATATPADPGSPPAEPPPPPLEPAAAGPAWFAVDGVGLVRLHDGDFTTVVEQDYTSKVLATGPDDSIWAGGIGGIYRIRGERVDKVGDSRTPGSVDALAVAPDGHVWALSHRGVHHFDGTAWSLEERASVTSDLLQDVAVTPDGKVWVASTHALHLRDGGSWQKVDLGPVVKDAPFFSMLLVGPDGDLYASSNDGIARRRGDAWEKVPLEGHIGSSRMAVGPGGRVAVVAGTSGLELHLPGRGNRTLNPEASGYRARRIAALAFDDSGRLWVATDNGVVVLGADGALLSQWKPGTVPAIAGTVDALLLLAGGPALPELGEVQKGTITGKIIRGGQPVTSVDVEICESPLSMFQQSPCDSASFGRRVQTDATGTFRFDDIPIGTYGFAIKPSDQWMVLIGADCCARMKPGSTYDVGSIPLDR